MFAPSSLEVLKQIPSRNYFPGESTATSVLRNAGGVTYQPVRSRTEPLAPRYNPYVKNGQFPNGTSITRDRNVSAPAVPNYDSAAASGVGLLSAATLAAPALLPVAAAAGIGYGTYKIGQALSLW